MLIHSIEIISGIYMQIYCQQVAGKKTMHERRGEYKKGICIHKQPNIKVKYVHVKNSIKSIFYGKFACKNTQINGPSRINK